MKITRNNSTPPRPGPAAYFTGTVEITNPFATTAPARLSGATVTFQPSARTAWHTHPLGQTILILSGTCRIQRAGGPLEHLSPGDSVFFEPNEKHWHGATPDAAMSHIAIAEAVDGVVVTWMEMVSDGEYLAESNGRI